MQSSAHILFVNTTKYLGGAEFCLLNIATQLNTNKFRPYLLASGYGPFVEQARGLEIPTFIQDFPWFSRRYPWMYWRSILELVRVIKINHISLIHTHCVHSLRYVMYTSAIIGVPYVTHIHDLIRPWFAHYYLQALKRAKMVIANSEFVAQKCLEMGVPDNKLQVIYNPINMTRFHNLTHKKQLLHEELNLTNNQIVIGIVGEIQPIKGHKEFIQASLLLAEDFNNVCFVVVGTTHTQENKYFLNSLINEIETSGHQERFYFLGFRYNIEMILADIDILVVPSWTEGFGRVVVEGLASGCAVIGSNIDGIPEILTHELDGLLIPPKNIIALYHAMRLLIINPKLRTLLAQNGLKTAFTRFADKAILTQIENLYESCLKYK